MRANHRATALILALLLAGCAASPMRIEEPPVPAATPPEAPPPESAGAAAPPSPYATWDTLGTAPPMGYAAYGYVVFTGGSAPAQLTRYMKLCEAFKSHVLEARDTVPAGTPTGQSTVTYWPVHGGDSTDADCVKLVQDYDYLRSQVLMKIGRIKGAGRGPFLLATAGTYRNRASARALVLDLSHVDQDQFGQALQVWREHIVEDPAVWDRGLRTLQGVAALVDFLNQYGCTALKTVGFDDHLTTACTG